jgi:Uma2 family endonuclease
MPETITLEAPATVGDDLTLAKPDISHLITETEEPVDNIISEKQMRLLTRPLYSSWQGLTDEQGQPRPFAVFANVGLYFGRHEDYLVPDVMLSLDVKVPEDISEKEHRTYLCWEYGKVPDVVIEIVSNRRGNEDGSKMYDYARGRVEYYVIYDPEAWLSDEALRVYELRGRRYVRRDDFQLPDTGLALTLWQGEFESNTRTWLRWCDAQGHLIPTGAERAATAEVRAATAEVRAATAEEKAARLAAKLRELGLDPEQI